MSCFSGRFCFDPCCYPCGIPAQWPAFSQQPVWPPSPPDPPGPPVFLEPSYIQLINTSSQTFSVATGSGTVSFAEQLRDGDLTFLNGVITFTEPGTYKVSYQLTASVSGTTVPVLTYLKTLGGRIDGTVFTIPTTQTNPAMVGGGAVIRVAKNQTLEAFADLNGTTAGTLTIAYGSLFAIRIDK